jgi:superfamily II DNA or RNA helicase
MRDLSASKLADFVEDECGRRLRAYEAQPRDANEHFETEIEVLSGGYAYRQLFELIQNAADAIQEAGDTSGRIYVRLEPNRLLAANTGAPLDQDGIVALLNARSSAKRAGQIGRFGIGFKSLLKLGGTVDIVSRSIGLRFDPDWCRTKIREHLGLPADARAPGMRLAQVLDPHGENSPFRKYGDLAWATTVVSAVITDEKAFERLTKEMEDFPQEFVLFLGADVELTLEFGFGKVRNISKRRENDEIVTSDGTKEERWRVFNETATITDADALSDAQHLQARDKVPLAWAVPLGARESQGRFWAFFPTNTPTLATGILNAPWKLNSDRTNIIPGPWNECLMLAAADLIAANIGLLATEEDPGAPISALPRKPDRQTDPAVPLVEALWDKLIDLKIVADISGQLKCARELYRHPFEDVEVVERWVALAGAKSDANLVHASCYTSKPRASRLEALQRELAERLTGVERLELKNGLAALQQISKRSWLELIAREDVDGAKAFLAFVGELFEARQLNSWQLHNPVIVPSVRDGLVSPSRAIIATPSETPAGLVPVLSGVASDPKSRDVLTRHLGVSSMADADWEDLLRNAFSKAQDDTGWEDFWLNVEAAPTEAVEEFFDIYGDEELCLRNLSGSFVPRGELLLLGEQEREAAPAHLQLDQQWHARHWERVPEHLRSRFPTSGTVTVTDWAEPLANRAAPFFHAVKSAGWRKMTGNPRHNLLNILELEAWRGIEMPMGWRLLPSLGGHLAAELTAQLIECAREERLITSTITYAHTTRPDNYPKFSAPHPFLYWLNEFGRVEIGHAVYPLKLISRELSKSLSLVGGPAAVTAATFYEWLDLPVDLKIGFKRAEMDSATASTFWPNLFAILTSFEGDFRELGPSWELGAAVDQVPAMVPTSQGVLPLSQIYVTEDAVAVDGVAADGRVVCLGPAALQAWLNAGANPLGSKSEIKLSARLSDPLGISEIFPELGKIIGDKELTNALARSADAVWVAGLTEITGPIEKSPTIARDASGLFLLDRDRFEGLNWRERMSDVLSMLDRHGMLLVDVASLMDQLATTLVDDARARVRSQPTIEEKLFCAVGDSVDELAAILPIPARQAVGSEISNVEWARLALAVVGPSILAKLSDRLGAQGLEPPQRWGGEPARQFVLELGFPAEFAASASVRREPELTISGPIDLPDLHDYQDEILEGLRELLVSRSGRRRAVVSLPTGGGKTRVAAEAVVKLILNNSEKRTALWVAQTDELCEQAVQCFRQLWVNVGTPGEDLRIVRLWGGQGNPAPPEGNEPVVVVASIQTLNARLEIAHLSWLAKPGVVVIDECHHAIAPSYSSLLRWLDVQIGGESERETEPPVIGLSATPWRGRDDDESQRLAARFDQRWMPHDQEALYERLRRRGVLSALHYSPIRYNRQISLTPDQARYFDQYGELPDSLIEEIGNDPDRNERILDCVLNSSASSILLFANSVKHAQYLAARLHLAGCSAAAVSGETDRLARQHFIRRFKSGELKVLCNHSVLTTGFDAPKADMILISRPVFSPVRYMQMVGRGLRGPANGGTESCLISTVEDNILSYRDRLAYHYCRRFFHSQ